MDQALLRYNKIVGKTAPESPPVIAKRTRVLSEGTEYSDEITDSDIDASDVDDDGKFASLKGDMDEFTLIFCTVLGCLSLSNGIGPFSLSFPSAAWGARSQNLLSCRYLNLIFHSSTQLFLR